MDWLFLGIAVVLLLLNAFFVGSEFALISARRSAVEPMAQQGDRRAVITLRAMEQVSLMMATAQLGITLCSLGLGAVGEPALAHLIEAPLGALGIPGALLHPIAFALALLIVVVLHVVIGEMIPKNIALAGPDRAALWLGPPLMLTGRLLLPLTASMNWLANQVLHLMKVEPRDEIASTFTRDEVHQMVEESSREGLLDEHERDLLARALHFEEGAVDDLVVPAKDVVATHRRADCGAVEELGRRSGFSRIALYDHAVPDRFVGYVHLKDVLSNDPATLDQQVPRQAIRRLPALPEGSSAREALELMRRTQAHMLQVQRDASTIGVVLMEDVLAQMVGGAEAAR